MDAARRRKHEEAAKRHNENPKCCKHCGNQLSYEKRSNVFCDSSCSASYTNAQRAKPLACAVCEQSTRARNKHCDSCLEQYGPGLNKLQRSEDARNEGTLRRYLLRTRDRTCQMCGLLEWNGEPTPLEVDHADGNSDNNAEDNVRLICPNCHAQLPTSRGRNRGNGRTRQKIKNVRYHAGLKY